MSLMDKILSSVTITRAVGVEPYKPVTGVSAYGNRFLSPITQVPPVADRAWTNIQATNINRDVQLVYSSPVPVVFTNGVAPTNGNMAPDRRGG